MLTYRTAGPVSNGDGHASNSLDEIGLARVAPFRVGTLAVDPPTLQVETQGVSRTIEPRVMQVLVALFDARGSVVSRDRLVELCWSSRAVSDDAINRCLAKVRRLGAESGAFEVETIARVGYRLMECASKTASRGVTRRMAHWAAIAAGLLVLVVAVATLRHFTASGEHEAPPIAVAGFTALNTGPDAKPYADSITAAVSDALVGTGARLTAADQPVTIEQAKRAGAALFIRGTVREQGGQTEVSASIVSTRTGAEVISKTFAVPSSEAASLPDQVAASLASTIDTWVTLARREPDPQTNEQLLRLVTLLYSEPLKAWALSRDLAEAKPSSAEAQTAFAIFSSFILSDIPKEQRFGVVSQARSAARRAADLSPASAFVLPCLLTPPGRLIITPECEKAVRRSLSVDHDPPLANEWLAEMLAEDGLFHDADPLSATALAQSPYDSGRLSERMFVLEMRNPAGRDNELPALRARAQRYAPEVLKDGLRYQSAIANGDMGEARNLLRDPAAGDGPTDRDIDIKVLRAVSSRDPADIAEARRECLPPPPAWNPPAPAVETCLVGLTTLGDLDSAFAVAGRVYGNACCVPALREKWWLDGGGLYYPRFELWGTAMAAFRDDPRFITVARNAGFLNYWLDGHPPDFCSFEPRAPVCQLLVKRLNARR